MPGSHFSDLWVPGGMQIGPQSAFKFLVISEVKPPTWVNKWLMGNLRVLGNCGYHRAFPLFAFKRRLPLMLPPLSVCFPGKDQWQENRFEDFGAAKRNSSLSHSSNLEDPSCPFCSLLLLMILLKKLFDSLPRIWGILFYPKGLG